MSLLGRSLATRPFRTWMTRIVLACACVALATSWTAIASAQTQLDNQARLAQGNSQIDIRVSAPGGFTASQVAALGASSALSDVQTLEEKPVFAQSPVDTTKSVPLTLVGESNGQVALRPLQLIQGKLPTNCGQVAMTVPLETTLRAAGISLNSVAIPGSSSVSHLDVSGVVASQSFEGSYANGALYIPQSCLTPGSNFGLGLHTVLVSAQLGPSTSFGSAQAAVEKLLSNNGIISNPGTTSSTPSDAAALFALLAASTLTFTVIVAATEMALSLHERRNLINLLRIVGATPAQIEREVISSALDPAIAGGVAGALISFIPQALLGMTPGLGETTLAALIIIVVAMTSAAWTARRLLAAPTVLAAREPVWNGDLTLGVTGVWLSIVGFEVVLNFGGAAQMGAAIALIAGLVMAVPAAVTYVVGRGGQPVDERKGVQRFLGWVAAIILFVVGVAIATDTTGVNRIAPLIALAVGILVAIRAALARDTHAGIVASLARRNVAARPRRVTLAVMAMTVASATAIAAFSITAAVSTASNTWVDALFPGAAIVVSPVAEPTSLVNQFSSTLPASYAISPILITSAMVSSHSVGVIGVDPSSFAGSTSAPTDGLSSSTWQELSHGQAIVPDQVASAYGWWQGETLTLSSATGVVTHVKIAAISAHTFPSSNGDEALVVDNSLLTAPGSAETFSDLAIDAPQSATYAISQSAIGYGWSVVTKPDLISAINNSLSSILNDATITPAILLFGSVLIAFDVMQSAMVDKRREIGLWRVVGMSRRDVRRQLMRENLLVGAMAVVCGGVAGELLSYAFTRAMSSPSLLLVPQTTWGLVGVPVIMVAATLLVSLAPARRLSNDNVIDALREE